MTNQACTRKNGRLQRSLFIAVINVLPLLGVLVWNWSLLSLLFLYWLESLVVGASNLILITFSNGEWRLKIGRTLFFILHYGGFWMAHGIFLIAILFPAIETVSQQGDDFAFQGVSFAFWGLLISYAVSTILKVLRTDREDRLSPTAQMFAPYGRVFVMHIVILGGAWMLSDYANMLPVLLLFVALKTSSDIITLWGLRIKLKPT